MGLTRGRTVLGMAAVVAAVLAILYLTGRLDPVLYRFGINHNPCTHTASGGIACGPGIVGTPYSNAGGGGSGGGGGGSLGGLSSSAGSVGSSVSGSAANSGISIP